MSDEKEKRPMVGDSTIRWMLTLLFAAGMAYASISYAMDKVPELEANVVKMAVKQAVIGERLNNIDDKLELIYDLLKHRRRNNRRDGD